MKLTWRTLLHIHIYLGLFCLPYLIIFSLSSLDFNHKFLPEKPLKASHTWKTQTHIHPQEDLEAYSGQLLDSLGLFGWFSPWDSYQDSTQIYVAVSQPGKKYHITVFPDGATMVEEHTETLSHVFRMMHFLGEDIPHAPWWVNSWQYYQDLTVYAMLFWVSTGIILWMRKKKRPVIEDRLLWTAGIVSILFILFIWLRN